MIFFLQTFCKDVQSNVAQKLEVERKIIVIKKIQTSKAEKLKKSISKKIINKCISP